MALGVKIKNLTTERAYTIEELYEAIKDKPFTAGQPSLTKHGPSTLITFPALDRQNQVWVVRMGLSASSKKWSVQKSEEAGLGNLVGNAVIDKATGGLFGFGRMVGGNAKKCEQQVEATAEELKALKL